MESNKKVARYSTKKKVKSLETLKVQDLEWALCYVMDLYDSFLFQGL